jgi:hypothetical protein
MRYSAMSLAYQLGAIVGGGFVPIVATALYSKYHTNAWTALYIALTSVLSVICVSRLQETAATEMSEPTPAADVIAS